MYVGRLDNRTCSFSLFLAYFSAVLVALNYIDRNAIHIRMLCVYETDFCFSRCPEY